MTDTLSSFSKEGLLNLPFSSILFAGRMYLTTRLTAQLGAGTDHSCTNGFYAFSWKTSRKPFLCLLSQLSGCKVTVEGTHVQKLQSESCLAKRELSDSQGSFSIWEWRIRTERDCHGWPGPRGLQWPIRSPRPLLAFFCAAQALILLLEWLSASAFFTRNLP